MTLFNAASSNPNTGYRRTVTRRMSRATSVQTNPDTASPHLRHPAKVLFPVITDREWAVSLRRSRAEHNEVSRRIREKLCPRKVAAARKDGL